MHHIEILEDRYLKQCQKNSYLLLANEYLNAERAFKWMEFKLHPKGIIGSGKLETPNDVYFIELKYSPHFPVRFDRVNIRAPKISYNDSIHIYSNDMSLCLYHPIIDAPFLSHIPLTKIIPWISEWIFFYEQWKKYGVWLGREIKHQTRGKS